MGLKRQERLDFRLDRAGARLEQIKEMRKDLDTLIEGAEYDLRVLQTCGEQQELRRHTLYTVVKRDLWNEVDGRYLYPTHHNKHAGKLWESRYGAEAAAREIGGIVAEVTFYDV